MFTKELKDNKVYMQNSSYYIKLYVYRIEKYYIRYIVLNFHILDRTDLLKVIKKMINITKNIIYHITIYNNKLLTKILYYIKCIINNKIVIFLFCKYDHLLYNKLRKKYYFLSTLNISLDKICKLFSIYNYSLKNILYYFFYKDKIEFEKRLLFFIYFNKCPVRKFYIYYFFDKFCISNNNFLNIFVLFNKLVTKQIHYSKFVYFINSILKLSNNLKYMLKSNNNILIDYVYINVLICLKKYM